MGHGETKIQPLSASPPPSRHHTVFKNARFRPETIYCNSYKGPNLSGVDPVTTEIVRLFHPRRDHWEENFRWEDAVLIGRTPTGRATIEVLRINELTAVALRRLFIRAGVISE